MAIIAGVDGPWMAHDNKGRYHSATKGIVQTGLVLNLDAGAVESYPGSGTTWTDLSPSGASGVLTNGPTFSSANGGGIVFDGTNDYISVDVSNQSSHTSCITFKITSFTTSDMRLFGARTGLTGQFCCGWNSTIFRIWVGTTWNNTSLNASTDTVYHVAIVHDSSNNNFVYVNGSLDTTVLGREAQYADLAFGGPFLLSHGSYFNGNIYTAQAYNRVLSISEIQQNYNATKWRFG